MGLDPHVASYVDIDTVKKKYRESVIRTKLAMQGYREPRCSMPRWKDFSLVLSRQLDFRFAARTLSRRDPGDPPFMHVTTEVD